MTSQVSVMCMHSGCINYTVHAQTTKSALIVYICYMSDIPLEILFLQVGFGGGGVVGVSVVISSGVGSLCNEQLSPLSSNFFNSAINLSTIMILNCDTKFSNIY